MKVKVTLSASYEYEIDRSMFKKNATNKDILEEELMFFKSSPEELLYLTEANDIDPIITIEQTEE
jgi:hypothetical protein